MIFVICVYACMCVYVCTCDVCGVCTVSVCAVCVCSVCVGGEILVAFKQNEVVSFVKIWIKLETIILTKSNQSRARIYTKESLL